MYSLRIDEIKHADDLSENKKYLNVTVSVLDDEVEEENEAVVEVRKFGFPEDYTKEQVMEELAKFKETYNAEKAQAVTQAVIDKTADNVSKIASELEGVSI